MRIVGRHFVKFREKFTSHYASRETSAWFPGHMYKGMLQMQAKLAVVDCILEVHDARIPFSGRNPKFYSMLTAIKPHILILNKSDLIESSLKPKIVEKLKKQNIQEVMFTDCKTSKRGGVDKVIPTALELVKNSELYIRQNAYSVHLMVIGVPNVGKSSLINRMRNVHLSRKKASAVGSAPGITKTVLEKIKILDNPLTYLFDTPGVIEPYIDNLEVGLRLALCHTLRDDLVGEELIADYLLFLLNKQKRFEYVKHLQLEEPLDDIRFLLLHIAKQNKFVNDRNIFDEKMVFPDLKRSSRFFINSFREGSLGKVFLDCDSIVK